MLTYTILVLALATTTAVSEIDPADEFAVKYDYLLRQSVKHVGREVVVEAFESFIEEFSDDPRVAEAMISLGDRVRNEAASGTDGDPSMKWYRRAADMVPAGSEVWLKAKFQILKRFPLKRKAEGRPILAEIAEHAKDNLVVLAQVELDLLTICREEDDLDAAERHCRNLLDFEKIHGRLPTDNLEQRLAVGKIRSHTFVACDVFMGGMRRARMSKAERAERINRLADDFPLDRYLQVVAKRNLEKLEAMNEWSPRPNDPAPRKSRPTTESLVELFTNPKRERGNPR